MGTRSDIIVHLSDDTWARIYCHWDGYLEHNGRILFDHYTSQSQAESLVALGDLSSLGGEVGTKHSFDRPSSIKDGKENPAYTRFVKRYGRMCTAYGRDRGEKDVAARIAATLAEVWPESDTWTEFTYVWDDGKWWVGDPDEGTQTLIDLGAALTGEKVLKPVVKAFGMIIGRHKALDPNNPDHTWKSSI